jgi:hypothetical protein
MAVDAFGNFTINSPSYAGQTTAAAINSTAQFIADVALMGTLNGNNSANFNYQESDANLNSNEASARRIIGNKPASIAFGGAGIAPLPTVANTGVDFDATLGQIKTFVDGMQDSWLMKYFPAAMPDGFDPLMTQILNGTIVTEAMQNILWNRAKAQGSREASRARSQVVSAWASRGFSLPGNVINKQLARISQDEVHANAAFAAQSAIKALDIQVESTKFAADIGTRLRLGLVQGLTGLVTAYSRLPSAAAEYAAAVATAKRASYDSIIAYYRAIITESELSVRAQGMSRENELRYAQLVGDWISKSIATNVSASLSASETMAGIGKAAVGGMNNITSLSASA